MSNFQPLQVVDRGSQTQIEVVTNLNELNDIYNDFKLKKTFGLHILYKTIPAL